MDSTTHSRTMYSLEKYAQPRLQTSDPAGIQTKYLWFSNHDRTECAIGADQFT